MLLMVNHYMLKMEEVCIVKVKNVKKEAAGKQVFPGLFFVKKEVTV